MKNLRHVIFDEIVSDGIRLGVVAAYPGVQLPKDVALVDGIVMLDYGLHLPIPISDLATDGGGISATLSFNRTPHKTYIPWGSVYIMAALDEKFSCLFAVNKPPTPPAPPAPPAPPKRPILRSV